MNDPASGVQQQLLPHMHLISKSRYPITNSLSMETAVDYLLAAPGVVQELQPMHWMFLDGPPDGTVMLAWQPLHHLGTNFASDGYVWADAEQAFTTEARGYTVEMWLHRSGYHPPNENVATHCRRRYRLTPSKNPNPNIPPCDPSLWIIHYSKAPATDHIPANRIPIVPQIQNVLSQRRFLQNQGQLPRKEFMLHDRNSWPTINLPQQGPQGIPPTPQYQPALRGRPQQAPFYQQSHVMPGSGGPAPTKGRGAPRGSAATAAGGANVDPSLEDEDVSAGDFLDSLTPRDISKMRYKQHHEWMEEVFSSAYTNYQIAPVDLGLGRKGELESLTAGYFNAPTAAAFTSKEGNDRLEAERIEPEKAQEFTDRVTRKVADMNAEIERMTRRHARRMEKVERTKILKEAELKLRDAVTDPSDVGTEIWRLEGRLDPERDGSASPIDRQEQKPKLKIDDVVRDLENAWGAKIVPAPTVTCVDKGGFQEKVEPKVPEESPNNGKDLGDMDAVMENADSHVRDQFGSTVNSPFGGQSTPFNGEEHLAVADSSGTFGLDGPDIATSESTKRDLEPETAPLMQGMDLDVEMSGVLNDSITVPENNNDDTGDWVMVNNEEDQKPSPPKDDSAQSGANIQPLVTAPTTTTVAPSGVSAAATSGVPPQVSTPESAPAVPPPVEVAASTAATAASPTAASAPTTRSPVNTEAPAMEAAQPSAPVPEPQQPALATTTADPATSSAPEQPQFSTATEPASITPAAPGDPQQQQPQNPTPPGQTGQSTLNPMTSTGGELDLPEMENSAFGDAFHVSDTERSQKEVQETEQGQEQDQTQGLVGLGQVEGEAEGEGGNVS